MHKKDECKNSGSLEMLRLREIAELDVKGALALIGGSEAIYKSTIKIVAKKIPTHIQTMTSYLEKGELKRFCVNVHSVKGSLASAGASALAQQALALELEAKVGNMDFCQKMFPAFAAELSILGEKIRPIFTVLDCEKLKNGSKPHFENTIALINEHLEEFNGDDALEILEELLKQDFGPQINELLSTLYEEIEMFEYENAQASLCALRKLTLLP